MEDARALLNSIMGADRNSNKGRRGRKFTDDDICKKFLVGLCPHELFGNTKMDIGSCGKHHNDYLKEEFEGDKDFRYYRRKWNLSLCTQLKGLLKDVDRRMETNHTRIEVEKERGTGAQIQNEQIARLKEKVSDKIQQAEALADNGNFEDSRHIMKEVESEKKRLEDLEALSLEKQKKEGICQICGQRVSADEADEIARTGRGFHTDGKQHLGFIAIRAKLKELEDQEERDKKDGIRDPSPSPVKVRSTETRRKRGRSKSPNASRNNEDRRRRPSPSPILKRSDKRSDGRRNMASRSRSPFRPRGGRQNASRSRNRKARASPSFSPRRKEQVRKRLEDVKVTKTSKPLASKSQSPSTKRHKADGSRRNSSGSRSKKTSKDTHAKNAKHSPKRSRSPPLPPSPPSPPPPVADTPDDEKAKQDISKIEEMLRKASQGDAEKAKVEKPRSPTPEPEKPKMPVRFVLGLGKLNVSALGRK